MTEYKKNILSGLFFLIIGVVIIILTPFAVEDPQVSAVGPREFPSFIGWAMVLISLTLIGQAMYKQHKTGQVIFAFKESSSEKKDRDKESIKNELRAFTALIIMLGYAISFDKIGYFASTFLAVTAYLFLLRVRRIWSYVISYAVAGCIWAAFTYLLSVHLP